MQPHNGIFLNRNNKSRALLLACGLTIMVTSLYVNLDSFRWDNFTDVLRTIILLEDATGCEFPTQ